jgi:GTP pyrophosphokinase
VVATIPDPDRVLDLSWHEESANRYKRTGRLKVVFANKPGSLAAMTTAISKQNGDIVNLKIINRTADFWELLVDVEVNNVDHLQTLKASLRSLSLILSVERI